MSVPFTLADLDRAAELVGRFVPPTPQYAWPLLGEAVGAEVWVKHENHTPTGAFKVRGGIVFVERHAREAAAAGRSPQGLISATRGNHGQSLAFAGRAFGVPVTIVVPHGNSPDKNAAMRGFGAELVEHGRDFQAAREFAIEQAAARDLQMVPSFHPDLVLGVATSSRELFVGAGALDTVYAPVGMGSGICALMAVRDLLGLTTEIVGVVSERAPATALSVAAGHVVNTATADTFIDGIACRSPDAPAIDAIIAGAARIVQITEDVGAEATRLLYRTTHNLPEPSGAAALAGLLTERDQQQGKRVGIIMSGGNIDTHLLTEILAGRTPVV